MNALNLQHFLFGWNGSQAVIDPLMTRERAALLLTAWRKNARSRIYGRPWTLKRLGPGIYQVHMSPDSDVGTLFIPRKAGV